MVANMQQKCSYHAFFELVVSLAFVVLFVTGTPCMHAQDASLSDLNLKEAGNFITALAIDKQNRLWVGAEDKGVSVLENDKWKNFGADILNESNCTALAITPGQTVWAGTVRHGIFVFAENKWKQIGILQGLPGVHVYALAPDMRHKNGVLCATEGGLCSVVLDEAKTNFAIEILPEPELSDGSSIREFAALVPHVRKGLFWAGALIGGIGFSDGRGWKMYEFDSQSVGGQINSMLLDRSNRVWAAAKHGLFRFDYKTGSWRNVVNENVAKVSITDPYFTSICEDNKGRLWLGTRRHGLCRYDPQFGMWQRIKKSVSDRFVSALCLDRDGKLWVGAYGKGLCRINPETIK